MTKTVVDCGNCAPDYSAIKRMVESHFDAVVEQTHGPEDTLQRLAQGGVDLVFINRKLDRDYSDGTEVLRQLKSDDRFSAIPVMLVTNYEEHQEAAMELGAERGFGKLALADPQTLARLKSFLS